MQPRVSALCRGVRARQHGNSAAWPLLPAGNGGGAPALARKHSQQGVPYGVSTVFNETLSEADPRALEGPAPGKVSLCKGATLWKQCGSTNRVNG